MRTLSTALSCLVTLAMLVASANACDRCRPCRLAHQHTANCQPVAAACGGVAGPHAHHGPAAPQVALADAAPRMVEKTVYEAQTVMEERTIVRLDYKHEKRTRMQSIHERIPVKRTVVDRITVMIPEKRTKVVEEVVKEDVWRTVETTQLVDVPYQAVEKGVRTVRKVVPQTRTIEVCRDAGRWVHVACGSPCNNQCGRCNACQSCCGCGSACGAVRRVWQSNIVREQQVVTVNVLADVQEPYEQTVTKYRKEERTRTSKVKEVVERKVPRQVTYTVEVPRVEERSRQITEYQDVIRDQKMTYVVLVPHPVEQKIQVPVRKMVARKVLVPATETAGSSVSCGCVSGYSAALGGYRGCGRIHKHTRCQGCCK